MEDLILKYLEQNYSVENHKIINLETGGTIYGDKLTKQLALIFSLENDHGSNILKNWFISKIKYSVFDTIWDLAYDSQIVQYEPKKQNRFLLTFPIEFNIAPFMVKSSNRPTMSLENNRVGVWSWGDLDVKFHDTVHPSTSQLIMDIMRNENIRNFDIRLEMLDPTGVTVEQWLINGFISQVDFGGIDYSSDDPVEITMTIIINTCILNF